MNRTKASTTNTGLLDGRYLKLNQSTPQTIADGIPLLEATRVIDSDNELVDKLYADTKIAKATNVTSVNDTGIADGEIAVFNLTNKDIRTSDKVFSIDGTLSGNSDSNIPTEKAIRTYADQLIAANNATIFRGVIDCSTNPNYPAADAGHVYVISVAGKIGGASGVSVEAGDMLLCLADSTASGDQATVGSYWNITERNLNGSVIGPASATAGNIAGFDGTTGKIIKEITDVPTATTIGTKYIYRAEGTDVPVADGGTGASTLTDHGLLVGSGVDAITPLGVATNGQIPIGSTGADPVLATLTEGEGIDITNTAGSITITGEDASTTNKGLVSLNSAHFSVAAGAVSLLADGIDDTLIDWGTGASQVSLDDVPDGTSYERVAANQLSSGIYIDATTANKGIASFDTNDFTVTAGAVSVKDTGIDHNATTNYAANRHSNIRVLGMTISSPAVGGIGWIRLKEGLTATRVDAYVIGGTSCTFNIEERTAPNSAGTNILTSDLAADADGASSTTFSNSGLAADNWLYIDISAASGTVSQIAITLSCTVT